MLSVFKPRRPQTFREVKLGGFRQRLPFDAETSHGQKSVLLEAFYPAEDAAPLSDKPLEPLFRPEVHAELGSKFGIPFWALKSLFWRCTIPDAPLPPAKPDATKKWPIIVFCSGLFGCCEMYTQFCRDMASLGFIVLALEHEDGSGVYATDGTTGELISYTMPPKGAKIPDFRRPQLERRVEELVASTEVIRTLAAADESSGSALAEVLRAGDPNDLLLVGHSFGAAGIMTYLKALSDSGKAIPYGSALLMDLWTEPMPAELIGMKPPVPIAMVISGEWVKTKPGIMRDIQKVRQAAGEQCLGAMHILGTLHQWISETQLLLSSPLLRKFGIMGRGDREGSRQATMQAVAAMLDAFRHKFAQDQLPETLTGLAKSDPANCELLEPAKDGALQGA